MTVAIRRPARRTRAGAAVWLPPVVVFLVFIGLWYLVSMVLLTGNLRYLLPAPHVVIAEFGDARTMGNVLSALGQSAAVALVGLLCAIVIGMGWAVVMSQARWAERALYPYAVLLQVLPILALVPLVGFWFGFGFPGRVIVCVLIALFPIVSNTLFGLTSVDPAMRDLFRLHGASRFTVLRKLQFPAAAPAIFTGLRISAGLSVVGALVGDFFFQRGEPGLGALISTYQATLRSAELFVAIIVACLFGLLVFIASGLLSRRLTSRWYDGA